MKQLALIGSTASGKTALSIRLAKKLDAYILSLDSLSIYKEIDIASAKPTLKEREGILHFGIDEISPAESFDVTTYIKLYKYAHSNALNDQKNLIIVGGTSFYLKILLEGISDLPTISIDTQKKRNYMLKNLDESYTMLLSLDSDYMENIKPRDSYRIEKALDIYLETGMPPSEYFKENPPMPIIAGEMPIYEIMTDRGSLRKKIILRAVKMLESGLIDETCALEKSYGRAPKCMKSIGIKETLCFLDGYYNQKSLVEKISINTGRLAKRQSSFNQSQFKQTVKGSVKDIYSKVTTGL